MRKAAAHSRAPLQMCKPLHKHSIIRLSAEIPSGFRGVITGTRHPSWNQRTKSSQSKHKTKSEACHLRGEAHSQPLRRCYISRKAYTFVFVTACVCLTVLVILLRLMKSRLAPKEQQMFSREGQSLQSPGANSKVHCSNQAREKCLRNRKVGS